MHGAIIVIFITREILFLRMVAIILGLITLGNSLEIHRESWGSREGRQADAKAAMLKIFAVLCGTLCALCVKPRIQLLIVISNELSQPADKGQRCYR